MTSRVKDARKKTAKKAPDRPTINYRQHPARKMARLPGDLTSAQIERIIAHHRQVLRYERNRQS